MNIRLTPEHGNLIQRKLESGSYAAASEVVIGLDDLDQGGGIRCNEQSLKAMFEEIKRNSRETL